MSIVDEDYENEDIEEDIIINQTENTFNKDVQLIHDLLFTSLYERYKNDNQFIFTVRQKNNKERLDNGYWFVGNDRYLLTSFWSGKDWKNKTPYINLIFLPQDSSDRNRFNVNDCYISLVCKSNDKLKDFYEKIFKKIDGFRENGSNCWLLPINENGYVKSLEYFLTHYKPIIDKCIEEYKPKDIDFLEPSYSKYINRIIERKLDK